MAKKHRIFQNIWNKAFKRGENPANLADDLGAFRGEVQLTEYDPKTGMILNVSDKHNTVTNLSKSNIIRLLSQSQSSWLGNITADDLRIQRMRFGNHSSGTATRLHYYKLDQKSTRPNNPQMQPGAVVNSFAGGDRARASILGANDDTFQIYDAFINYTPASNAKIYDISSAANASTIPPSHGTMIVEFYKTAGATQTLVETLTFANPVYTRARLGIAPTTINSPDSEVRVVTPVGRSADYTVNDTNRDQVGTRLYYDYDLARWRLKVMLIDNEDANYDLITIKYKTGQFNVINSIVPREGVNSGSGTTASARFGGNTDWYPILAGSEYRDAADDFIDDYGVTFSVNMTGQYGNGNTNAAQNEVIRYKEAFLFNGLDEMMSMVVLPSSFDKNANSAFFIAWSILSPLG